jgi:hypothetical protein
VACCSYSTSSISLHYASIFCGLLNSLLTVACSINSEINPQYSDSYLFHTQFLWRPRGSKKHFVLPKLYARPPLNSVTVTNEVADTCHTSATSSDARNKPCVPTSKIGDVSPMHLEQALKMNARHRVSHGMPITCILRLHNIVPGLHILLRR